MNEPTLFENPDTFKPTGNNILPKDGEALFFPHYFNQADSNRLLKSLTDNILWQQDRIKMYAPIPLKTQPHLDCKYDRF
jgi:hypothetical protein